VRNSLLVSLDLRGTKNLVELKCLNNPYLTNLTMGYSPNLQSFECLGTSLVAPSISTLTPNILSNFSPNNYFLPVATAIPSGTTLLSLIGVYYYRRK
jgi:hypothetical protein